MENFLKIMTKPDNIPIAVMMLLVLFFTFLGLKEAFVNDRFLRKGKGEEEILNRMEK